MTFSRWSTFLLRCLIVTLAFLLFWIYFFLLTLVFVLQWFFLHWEILIMFLSQSPLIFCRTQNRIPHSIVWLMAVFVLIRADLFLFFVFFFYQGFLSRTLTIHRTAGEGKGPSFIPLYHFHPLTNIQTFICNFACEMTITYF